mgnify:CR=1 FL=1
MHPEFKALLETVGPNGEFIDTNMGRTINPGHCIETAWFLLEEAKLRGEDKEIEKPGIADFRLVMGVGAGIKNLVALLISKIAKIFPRKIMLKT